MGIATFPTMEEGQASILDSLAREFEEAFAELSESAEKELSGKTFVFSSYGRELYPYFESTDAQLVPGCIVPIKEGRPVASVDSTCFLVGETARGSLYAARTAVGISFGGSLRRFFRLGPILVYASSSGISGLSSRIPSSELDLLLSDHAVAERYVRNSVEKRVIEALAGADAQTIVMADGSLKHPMGHLSHSLTRWTSSGASLVGFSKSTNLMLSEEVVSALSRSQTPSFYILDDSEVSTVLAKFTPDGLVFRLDLAGPEPSESTLGGYFGTTHSPQATPTR